MPDVIGSLRQEHVNISRILDILEQELALFDEAGQPDYEVFRSISDYFLDFPDTCHHPKEDVIFGKLKERDPARAEVVGRLAGEHREIGRLARGLAAAVDNVLGESEVPRSAFHRVVSNFIDRQREHLLFEERVAFPAALAAFGDEDWDELDARMADETDPLLDTEVSARFEDLRKRILDWNEENAAERAVARPAEKAE